MNHLPLQRDTIPTSVFLAREVATQVIVSYSVDKCGDTVDKCGSWLSFKATVNPRYNGNVRFPDFCRYTEFAGITNRRLVTPPTPLSNCWPVIVSYSRHIYPVCLFQNGL